MTEKTAKNNQSQGLLSILLAYNLGRLMSYSLAGGVMGSLGWFLANWADIRHLQILLQLVAGIFMLLMGLYMSGWWMWLAGV